MLQAQSDQIFDHPNVIWPSNIIQAGEAECCLQIVVSKPNGLYSWHIPCHTHYVFSLIADVLVLLSDRDNHRLGHTQIALEEVISTQAHAETPIANYLYFFKLIISPMQKH